jgi:hypothetical protein
MLAKAVALAEKVKFVVSAPAIHFKLIDRGEGPNKLLGGVTGSPAQ